MLLCPLSVLRCCAAVAMQGFCLLQLCPSCRLFVAGCIETTLYSRVLFASGVIPIDRLTDVRTPVAVVCERIARPEFERVYGLKLPKPDEHDAPNK